MVVFVSGANGIKRKKDSARVRECINIVYSPSPLSSNKSWDKALYFVMEAKGDKNMLFGGSFTHSVNELNVSLRFSSFTTTGAATLNATGL